MSLIKSKSLTPIFLTEDGIKEKIKLTEKFVARKKVEYDELYQELEEYRQSEIVK